MYAHVQLVRIGVKRLESLKERQKLFVTPSLSVEIVIIDSLASSIYL